MISERPPNSSFSQTLPGLQLAWDSVSRGALKKCPRYYEYSIIRGLRPKRLDGFDPAYDLTFGIWMHEGRERYYRERALGASHDDALDSALEQTLKATWNRDLQRPWMSGDSNKNRRTLIRSLVWYLDKYGENDPLETVMLADGKPAVELSFSLGTGLVNATGEEFLLCGHMDRLVKFQDQVFISDLKTTKHTINAEWFHGFSPDDQLTGYLFASKAGWSEVPRGIIIDGIQVAVEFTRCQRGHSARTQSQLDEWFNGFRALVTQATQYAHAQFWPMNEKSCFRCDFRGICSKSPTSREAFLKSDFEVRVWDPMKVRGDV